MNKNLLAFFLACLSITFPLACLTFINRPADPVHIAIRSNKDVADVVTAIESLHRTDVTVQTIKDQNAVGIVGGPLVGSLMLTLSLMFISGCVGAIYKFYCKKLGVEPVL